MSECTQCGKRTTPDSIHTCSPQVQRDETLPAPFTTLMDGTKVYDEAALREAIKGARKGVLQKCITKCEEEESAHSMFKNHQAAFALDQLAIFLKDMLKEEDLPEDEQ